MHGGDKCIPHPFHHALLGQADNPRRLVPDDGGCASSCSFPYPTEQDGIPGWVPGYHRLGPLQGLMVSRYPGAYASPLHRRGGNHTRTGVKLSQVSPVQPIPGCVYSRFWLTNRTDLLGHRRPRVVVKRLLQGVVFAHTALWQRADPEATLALCPRRQHVLAGLLAAQAAPGPDMTDREGGQGGGEAQRVLALLDQAQAPLPDQRDCLGDRLFLAVLAADEAEADA